MIRGFDTVKYNIVNQKYKELKVFKEIWYSDDGDDAKFTMEYDTFGRIIALYNQVYFGEKYFYLVKNDTLIKLEYELRKSELTRLNNIEKFIYSQSGNLKTYISTSNYITHGYLNTDSSVIIEVDQLYYDTLQRIEKIEHFSKIILNQKLQLNKELSMDSLHLTCFDIFTYDYRQQAAIRLIPDNSNNNNFPIITLFDDRNRKISETKIYPSPYNINLNDTVEKKYTYEDNKVTCFIKEPELRFTGLPNEKNDEIRTEYYNEYGLLIQSTHTRVRLNLLDIILYKYEFY